MENGRELQIKEIQQKFHNLFHSLRKVVNKKELTLTGEQYHLLGKLAKAGRTKMSLLAEEVGLSASTVTISCNRLEKEGLIVRERDKEDRRVVWVATTSQGETLVAQVRECFKKRFEEMLQPLNDVDLAQLNMILGKISDYDPKGC